MGRRPLSDEQLLDALWRFARTHLVPGGSLRVKAYTDWADAPISFTPIARRFGDNSWATVVLRFREQMLAQAPDMDAVAAELPVPCRGNVGVSWVSGRVGDWPSLRCDCGPCQSPTLRSAHPELVERLHNPADADKASMLWFEWACPQRRPRHRPFRASVDFMLAGKVYCRACRESDEFYTQHPIGSLVHNGDVARSKVEAAVVEGLRELLPDERFATRQSIVIGPDHADLVGRAITPDIVMFRRKLAIEIDGGDGNSPHYSTHDTAAGARIDAQRDQALASLGWRSIRLRHPNALPLASSPATIVPCASQTPKIMAAALADAIRTVVEAT